MKVKVLQVFEERAEAVLSLFSLYEHKHIMLLLSVSCDILDSGSENCRSVTQEHATALGLAMFGLLVERCIEQLKEAAKGKCLCRSIPIVYLFHLRQN